MHKNTQINARSLRPMLVKSLRTKRQQKHKQINALCHHAIIAKPVGRRPGNGHGNTPMNAFCRYAMLARSYGRRPRKRPQERTQIIALGDKAILGKNYGAEAPKAVTKTYANQCSRPPRHARKIPRTEAPAKKTSANERSLPARNHSTSRHQGGTQGATPLRQHIVEEGVNKKECNKAPM